MIFYIPKGHAETSGTDFRTKVAVIKANLFDYNIDLYLKIID